MTAAGLVHYRHHRAFPMIHVLRGWPGRSPAMTTSQLSSAPDAIASQRGPNAPDAVIASEAKQSCISFRDCAKRAVHARDAPIAFSSEV
jgi:hypothetical protein